MMDLRSLKYFVAVARELNIGRAANILHISQPPLTRQIQQLEAELGVTLFLRNFRGVELTDAGTLLLEEATNILALVDRAVERTKRAGQGLLGRIDIGVFGSAVLEVIPRLLLNFRKAYPDVSVVLHTMSKGEQIEALRQRRITIGFNRFLDHMPDIGSEVVLMEKMFAALSENDPLVGRDSLTLADLKEHAFVMFPSHSRPNFIDRVLHWCRKQGFSPKVSQEVGDAVTAVALVGAGLGICLVPESATSLSMPGVVYRPLTGDDEMVSDLSCIYRKDDHSPILLEFLHTMRQAAVARRQGDTQTV
jgi:DNA-binding transcriptional LysR family regulator